jgi:hypothetical protein
MGKSIHRLLLVLITGVWALIVVVNSSYAQTIIEMSSLMCGDYLESPPARQDQYAAWISGYYNAARNIPMVDLKRFANNKKLVEKYCRGHREDRLMDVVRKVAI